MNRFLASAVKLQFNSSNGKQNLMSNAVNLGFAVKKQEAGKDSLIKLNMFEMNNPWKNWLITARQKEMNLID